MSRHHRFFIDVDLSVGDLVALPPDRGRQLLRVLRAGPGEQVTLVNGDGFEYRGVLVDPRGGLATVELRERRAGVGHLSPGIDLAVALIKAERFDWIVQKATELGVRRLIPLAAERAVVSLPADRAAGRRERWRRIAIEAVEQSGRADLPDIAGPTDLRSLLAAEDPARALVLWEGEAEVLLPAALSRPYGPVLIVVGPEGGFSDDEIALARSAGARLASLGPLTLRSETAAIAAVAAVRALADAILCGNAWSESDAGA